MPTVYLPCYSICPNHLPAHFFLSCVYFANIYYLKIFLLVCHLFYHSLNNAFPRAKVLVLMKSNLSIYIFVDDVFDIIYKKVWLIQDHTYFLLCFCLKYSILHKRYSVFTFKSKFHFELTTVYCITYGSKFFYILISNCSITISKRKKKKILFLLNFSCDFVKSQLTICVHLFPDFLSCSIDPIVYFGANNTLFFITAILFIFFITFILQ